MDKNAILKTAITTWSDEDECYVMQSPLCDVLAVGDTEQEAQELFEDMVTEYIKSFKANRLAFPPKMGRPAKGKVNINIQIAPDVQSAIKAMSKDIGLSQGETVEYLYSFWKAQKA